MSNLLDRIMLINCTKNQNLDMGRTCLRVIYGGKWFNGILVRRTMKHKLLLLKIAPNTMRRSKYFQMKILFKNKLLYNLKSSKNTFAALWYFTIMHVG